MTQTPLQQLTTLIYASNPELMTLGVGCEVRTQKYTCEVLAKFGNNITCIDVDNKWIRRFELDKHYFEIIGKPPTLVDVRNWIKTLKSIEFNYSDLLMIIFGRWNNSIYLRDQSPELINFLININK